MSSKGTTASLTAERVRIFDQPEDPERNDFPWESELAPLRRSKQRRSPRFMSRMGNQACCSCGWLCACVVLALGLALLLAYTARVPVRPESLKEQVLGAIRDILPRTQAGKARPGGAGAAEDTPRSASSRRRPAKVVPPPATGDLDSSTPAWEQCNITAPLPEPAMRLWELTDDWKRVCEQKNRQDKYPLDRNWCWVGFNNMCHWNLKAHKSWATFQEMAASSGFTPPARIAPFSPLEFPEVCDRPENGRPRDWTAEEFATARQWFKDNIAVYVLSLPGIGDPRWAVIHKRLNDLEIRHTRVPGVDMRAPGALDAAKKLGFVPMNWNFSKAQDTAYEWKHNMGSILGTTGCAAAHFKVQRKVIADGSAMAIVMEDDSWVSHDFVPRVWSLVHEELPCDWEVVALLSRCGYGRCVSPRLMRVLPDANEPAYKCHQGSNWGMHAVLYNVARLPKLQVKWQQTVFNESRPHCMDVDVALASISDQVGFYAVPAVQDPGFVREMDGRSARWDINQDFASTATSTSTLPTAPPVTPPPPPPPPPPPTAAPPVAPPPPPARAVPPLRSETTSPPAIKPGEPWPGAWKFT